jgi:aminopeptidase N
MKLKLIVLTFSSVANFMASQFVSVEHNSKSINASLPITEVQDDSLKVRNIYNSSRTLLTDLIHTKLEVSFDWSNSYLMGRETLTAKPHFYPSDSLILDAKGMEISKVSMNGSDLTYQYDDALTLKIKLDREYTSVEKYTIIIEYVAKPDERETSGSAAILSDKGLYFINPKGEDPTVMPQIWTQGETESNSVWFPTIDAPNSKTTQELFITVKDRYVTLSNGSLISSKKKDGMRTDHWKQDLPHAPYLFMMAVGEFSIVKDSYTKKDGSKIDVNYYVESEYRDDARAIFGETPAMIKYFSDLLGVEYPWDKYNQIVVRDYVSGAMENTGAVIFGDYVYKDSSALLDENDQSTIAHELFHHWFGDLVTCESWANLPLNESFANYSQYLWDEYRYGADEADYQAEVEVEGYYQSAAYQGYHDLIWYDHLDKEDMFDGHSYNKGGRILHMLRAYLGDKAFFKGLNKYLTDNKYTAAEVHHLRMAFEEVSGEDLNWFFNQWFLGKGHLILFADYEIDKNKNEVTVEVSQRQNKEDFPVYRIPTEIAIWTEGNPIAQIHKIEIDEVSERYTFSFDGEIANIQIDPRQVLLAKVYEEKPAAFFKHQFYNSSKYKSRKIALERALSLHCEHPIELLSAGLNDSFWHIRALASDLSVRYGLIEANTKLQKLVTEKLENDSISQVRSAMCEAYLETDFTMREKLEKLEGIILKDASRMVRSNAFSSLVDLDQDAGLAIARSIQKDAGDDLLLTIAEVYSAVGEEQERLFFEDMIFNQGEKWKNEGEIRMMFYYISYTLRQDISLRERLPEVLKHYKENGGSYIKMYFARAVQYCISTLEEELEVLKIDADDADNSVKLLETMLKELGTMSGNE